MMEKPKAKKSGKNPNKPKIDIKSQINNEIIHTQGKFKQAKIGTIRKLVDKLKHPDKNPKQNRASKSERYQNVLNHIKHMSPKRLALLGLLYYKSGKNYLADQNATVEQLSIGYFSQFKGLNVVFDTIRSKCNLTDNSNWRKHVKKLFKKKDPTKKVQKKTPFTESDEPCPKMDVKLKNKKSKRNVESNEKLDKSRESGTERQKPKQNTMVTKEINESSGSDDESEVEISGENDANTVPPTTIDDFFITADGSNYLSTAVVSRNQEEGSDDESKGHLPRSTDFEKKSRESSFFHKSNKKPVKLAVNRSEGLKRKFTNDEDNQIFEKKPVKIDPELHPSWQAKQKLKPTITEFKGKKITFD